MSPVFTSAELKTSGSRKLSRAHSSWRLFWRGVPVSSRRLVVLNSRTISDSCEGKKRANFSSTKNSSANKFSVFFLKQLFYLTLDFSFLILWASSITRYLQLNFLNTAFSMMSISYDVTQTSHSPGRSTSLIRAV